MKIKHYTGGNNEQSVVRTVGEVMSLANFQTPTFTSGSSTYPAAVGENLPRVPQFSVN
ncbi:MAG TPA: hypothetical protein VGL27_18100 [Negativicutes bacterium]